MPLFSPFYAQLYELHHTYLPQDEFERILGYARKITGPILEAMCGSGRFLVPLCEQRGDVDGLDACPFMLKICRNKLAQKNLKSTLYMQNIERMKLKRKYDLIFVTAKSLCMIRKEMLPRVIKKIHDHLNPGGFFVFDLWEHLEPGFPQSHQSKFKEKDLVVEGSFEFLPSEQIFHIVNRYEGREDRMEIQLYEKEEILQLLKTSGFSLINIFGQAHFAKIDEHLFNRKAFWIESTTSENP